MISLNLSMDGQTSSVQLPDKQIELVYRPIMHQVIEYQEKLDRRLIMGVSGPPGCGKTYFSKLLAALLNRQLHDEAAICVGLDGWHYQQKQLEQMTFCRDGKLMLLKAIKGAPESFNIDGFLDFLDHVRMDEELSFPIYDRTIHDPVENSGQIQSHHRLIIIEGNYILLDEVPWDKIRAMLDISCFIWAGEKLRWDTLLKRHLKGGKSPSQALRHTRTVDMANAKRIGRPDADIQILRLSDGGLAIQ